MKQYHDVQLKILRKLLFAQSLPYSQLKPDEKMENNQLSFHLDKLKELGYIEKLEEAKGYKLTQDGKEYANRMDTETNKIQKQGKNAVLLCCWREGSALDHNEREYLIYTRRKQPFYGKQGFLTGKVNYGETVLETARRELKEETNLEGQPSLAMIKHYHVYDKSTGKLLEDKFFYVCLCENPEGELQGCEEGEYERVKKSELRTYITNPFDTSNGWFEFLNEIETWDGQLSFQESTYDVTDF